MKYFVTYKGKQTAVNADNAEQAMLIFSNRKVFGQRLFEDFSTDSVDADTRGVKWGKFKAKDSNNHAHTIMIELAPGQAPEYGNEYGDDSYIDNAY